MRTHISARRSLLAIGLVAAMLTLGACAAKNNVTGAGGLTGSAAPSAAPAVPSATAATPTTTSTSTATATSKATATATATKAAGPAVNSFIVSQKPSCPIVPTTAAPFSKAAVNIKLKWKVTGASKVALSLDDKNFFKKYGSGSISDFPTSDEVDLTFACDVTVQPNTTHSYYLNTIGGGPSVQRVLTVTVQTSP